MTFPTYKHHCKTCFNFCVFSPFFYLQNLMQSCGFSSCPGLEYPMSSIFPKDYYTFTFNHKTHHVFKFGMSEIKCSYFIPTGTSTYPSSLCNIFLFYFPSLFCSKSSLLILITTYLKEVSSG